MANPTIHIDGDKRRIYEVPDLSSFVVDVNGYRVYAPTVLTDRENEFVQLQFQDDIWSRFQDWHKANEWSTIALGRSGGASRGLVDGVEGFATNDYEVLTLSGWAFVPADYPHTLEIFGNMLSDQQGVSVFDAVRLTSIGVLAYVRMADSFQVVKISTGSVLTPEQDALLTSIYNEVIYIERWIHIDTEQAIDGNGTQKSPFNNLDSALTYMEANNLLRIHTVSDLTLDRTSKNFVVIGIGNPTIDFNGQNLNGSQFQNCTLRGTMTGAITVDNCDLLNNVQIFGRVRRSAFLGTVEQMGSTNYNGCYSGVTGLGYPKLKITAGNAGVRRCAYQPGPLVYLQGNEPHLQIEPCRRYQHHSSIRSNSLLQQPRCHRQNKVAEESPGVV